VTDVSIEGTLSSLCAQIQNKSGMGYYHRYPWHLYPHRPLAMFISPLNFP